MIFRDAKVQIVRRALESMPVTPRVIVEFGTFVGNSALAWGAIMQSLHGDKKEAVARGCRVYTFELDEKLVGVSREFVRLAGLEELVMVVQGPAAESLRDLYEDGSIKAGGVDVVFFDHWEKYYLSDLKLCETLGVLREGSLVIADNTDMPGAPDYLAYVRAQSRYNSKAIPSTEKRGVPVRVTECIRRVSYADCFGRTMSRLAQLSRLDPGIALKEDSGGQSFVRVPGALSR